MTTPTDAPATPTCNFPGHSGPAGQVNACQLCPISPTYWRGPGAEPPAANSKPCRWTSAPVAEAKP